MKILFVSSGLRYEYGGAPLSEASLVAALSPHSEVRLACPSSRLDQGFSTKVAGKEALSFTPAETIFALLLKKNRLFAEISSSDLVHLNGHWRWENLMLSLLCERLRIPYLVHPRGMLWLGHRKKTIKRLFNYVLGYRMVRKAAIVVALSEFETKQWKPYHLRQDRVRVIPNGFTALDPTDASPSKDFFLFVGRIESRKNVDFLVRAFAEYRADGGKLKLVLMGPEEHGYGDSVRALARELGVTPEVEFVPPAYGGDKWDRIRNARAVIYPSVEEAFGRVPFEAALAETVAVVPIESGSYEYLEPFFGPYFFALGDRPALVRTLHGLEKFPPDRERIRQAREYVETDLSWKVIGSRFLKLYQSLKPLADADLRKVG